MMMVKDLFRMFSMLQEIEVYPVLNSDYDGSFYFEEECAEDRPIFRGMIKDAPFWMLECLISEEPLEYGESIIDCRSGCSGGPGGTTLVFEIKEPEGV